MESKISPHLKSVPGKRQRIILWASCMQCKPQLLNMGYPVHYEYPLINAYCIEAMGEQIEQLARCDFIQYVHPDSKVHTQMNIAGPAIGTLRARELSLGGEGIGVAVADTGVYPHVDFLLPTNRIAAFVDFVGNRQEPYDDNGHGTFVSGEIMGSGFASGGLYQGIAPQAHLISLKVMDAEGGGSASDILAAMQWVADHKDEYNIRIFNLSLGAAALLPARLDPLARAAESLWDLGIVVVAAAGNSGPLPHTITTPGISPKIITVGAVNDQRTVPQGDDTIAEFSSRGPAGRSPKPDIVAPGVSIISVKSDLTYPENPNPEADSYITMTGTSMAAPIVAGASALVIEKYPQWGPDNVKYALEQSAYALPYAQANVTGRGEVQMDPIWLMTDALSSRLPRS